MTANDNNYQSAVREPEAPLKARASAESSSEPKSNSSSEQLWCPHRQATLLQHALSSGKMKIGFFLGAGCPTSIRLSDNSGGNKPLIPAIDIMTKSVSDKMISSELKESFELVLRHIEDRGNEQANIEDILTHIRSLQQVLPPAGIDGCTKEHLDLMDMRICQEISNLVKVPLPNANTPYHKLAAWIGAIPRAHPVEVFTSNYDLLMEQAFEECRVPYFDGFVGSASAFFDPSAMERDALPPRWARLWKVHGSINWWRTESGEICRKPESAGCQMIYPSHLKYEESRRLPYLAMLDRLHDFLQNGQAVLVTCGYSFSDQHLNDIILQGLSSNPHAVCFALSYGDRSTTPEAIKHALHYGNLRVLAADGAVLGTVEADWVPHTSDNTPITTWNDIAVIVDSMNGNSCASDDQLKFVLGDFAALGEFLGLQIAGALGSGELNER